MKTWIVVADSTRARIFEHDRQQPAPELQLITNLEHPAAQAHERDLTTDRPGRTFDRMGPGRHAMSESVSPKDHEAGKWCKELSDEIEKARLNGSFDRMVIIAAPAFLGQLRKMLPTPTSRLVAHEIDKNLAHMDVQDIRDHIPAEVF